MGRSLGGVATAYNAVQTNYLIEGTLNYTENLDNHRINAVVGVTTQRFMRKTSNMQGNNFVTDATGASNIEKLFPCMLLVFRSEEHTSELQSRGHLACRLLLEKNKDD